jgi:hypothetical protein
MKQCTYIEVRFHMCGDSRPGNVNSRCSIVLSWLYKPNRLGPPPLFLGDINTGTWHSRLGGVSDETAKYGYGL